MNYNSMLVHHYFQYDFIANSSVRCGGHCCQANPPAET